MSFECINPEYRDWLRIITESTDEDIAALDFEDIGYAEICEARLHWNCCPSCRDEFSTLPTVAEKAGTRFKKCFAADLTGLKDDFVAKKRRLLESEEAEAYVEVIAGLAGAEFDVHDSLRRALMVTQNIYRGVAIEFDPAEQEILSHCREFVSSLDANVQHFVISATFCFELLRPMWERVGLEPRGRPKRELSWEELMAEIEHRQKEPPTDLGERLRHAIAESGLEGRVLLEIIESAASARISKGEKAVVEGLLEAFKGEFNDFADSMKAGQMEIVRLSERSLRRADQYEPEISAQMGSALFSKLHEMTQQLLKQAEFQYHINNQEPNYFHGPTLTLALAYETELNIRVVWPILNQLLESGTEDYGSTERPLIKQKQINELAVTTGTVARYLRKDVQFSNKVRALGFNAEMIAKDAAAVTKGRDKAAHYPVCERAIADDLRRLMLRPDGILSRLHPAAINRVQSGTKA
jgi:hypothetical protein